MKNKKNRLIFGLLILTIFLGVGFAVVSSVDLTVSGTASSKDHNLAVYFSSATTSATTSSAAVNGTNSLLATITVSDLEKVNDSVTATYTIKNDEPNVDALISLKDSGITVEKSEFFQVTTSVDSTSTRVTAGGTNTVTVTVKLIKVPLVDADSESDITVEFEATATDPA